MWITKRLNYSNGRIYTFTPEWVFSIDFAPKLMKVKGKYFQHVFHNTDPHTNETICEYTELEEVDLHAIDTTQATPYEIPKWDALCECGSDVIKAKWHSWYCPKFEGFPFD